MEKFKPFIYLIILIFIAFIVFYNPNSKSSKKYNPGAEVAPSGESVPEGYVSQLENEEAFGIEKKNKITELETKILSEGTGIIPAESTDTVTANYRGWIAKDGIIFDHSFQEGSTAGVEFSLLGVIPGWTEGVSGMVVGEVRRLYIPWELAYGAEGNGSAIGPKADLIFDVELLKIK